MGSVTKTTYFCDWCGRENDQALPTFGEEQTTATMMTCGDCAQKFTIAELAKKLGEPQG